MVNLQIVRQKKTNYTCKTTILLTYNFFKQTKKNTEKTKQKNYNFPLLDD